MSPQSERAFTRIELMALVAMLAVLAGLVMPMMAETGRSSRQVVCLGNLGAIIRAANLYAAENQGVLPNPGWGLISGDNWCYGSANQGRLPGQPSVIPDAAGRLDGRSRQEPFRRLGQLWPYLRSESVYYCPDDVFVLRPDDIASRFRILKLSSYCANGSFNRSAQLSTPLRIDEFLAGDFAFWEPAESEPFFFNDPSNSAGEALTGRHGPQPQATTPSAQRSTLLGGGNVASMGGTVEWMSTTAYLEEIARPVPNRGYPNRP